MKWNTREGGIKTACAYFHCQIYHLRVAPTTPPPPPPPPPPTNPGVTAVCSSNMQQVSRDSILHELILTFLAGATSDLTAGQTPQEPCAGPTSLIFTGDTTCSTELHSVLFDFTEMPEYIYISVFTLAAGMIGPSDNWCLIYMDPTTAKFKATPLWNSWVVVLCGSGKSMQVS